MELLEGETLGELMRRDGALRVQALLPIVTGTCAGLSAAHARGIVHRDLKPDNVFLAKTDGEGDSEGEADTRSRSRGGEVQVKLLDFGIAKVVGKERLTQTGAIVGTPRYMAPEQLAAERDLDARTDVYALGVILYEALAGKPPFLSSSPSELVVDILHGKHAPLRSYRPDLPTEVEAVVSRAMARAKEARYASATELAEAFVEAAGTRKPVATPVSAPRDGVSTAFMGSVGARDPAVGEAEKKLEPGTFSELARVSPAEVHRGLVATVPATSVLPPLPSDDAPAIVASPTARRELGAAETPPAPSSPPRRVAELPMAASTPPPVERARDHSEPRIAHPASSSTPGSDAYRLPTRGPRTAVIVVGLVSGALSAAIAIIALSYFTRPPEEPPVADSEGAGVQSPEAAALVRDARAALGVGDAARCVALADRALAAGADATVHRLRGDCLLASGDRPAALESYRAFCRDAADHPGIEQVRMVVEELGGTCP
jgi:serine/threonine-protein kinase